MNTQSDICNAEFIKSEFKRIFKRMMYHSDFRKIPLIAQYEKEIVRAAFDASAGKTSLNYTIAILESGSIKNEKSDIQKDIDAWGEPNGAEQPGMAATSDQVDGEYTGGLTIEVETTTSGDDQNA